MTDPTPFERFADGDKNAYQLLYKQYVNALYGYGCGMGFDRETCMDAIHDVFFKLYSLDRQELKRINNFKSFIFRSFRNRLIDIQKAKRPQTFDKFEELPFTIRVNADDVAGEWEDREEIRMKIEQLLGALTDRQREAIYLRYMQEMEYCEISLQLNMAPESVRKLVFRAISKLRSLTDSDTLLLLALYSVIFPK